MAEMGRIGQSTVEKCQAYSATLGLTARKLRETAAAYAAAEDEQGDRFRRGPA